MEGKEETLEEYTAEELYRWCPYPYLTAGVCIIDVTGIRNC
jgi:hypothetical protein